MADLKLAASSARTRPRSFTPMPAPWPRTRTAARFSPLTDALRQQNPSLPVSLTGLVLAHRPGQVKPRRLAVAAASWRSLSWRLQRRRADGRTYDACAIT
jgi:hypothetical protein